MANYLMPPPDALTSVPYCETLVAGIIAFSPGGDTYNPCCGRVAVKRYPAADGRWTHLCLGCSKPHAEYVEPCCLPGCG